MYGNESIAAIGNVNSIVKAGYELSDYATINSAAESRAHASKNFSFSSEGHV
jgi:hypothetical protein